MADTQSARVKIEAELAVLRERQDEARCRIKDDDIIVDSCQGRIAAYEHALVLIGEAPKRGRKPGNGAAKPVARVRKVKPPIELTLNDLTDSPLDTLATARAAGLI